MNFAIVIRKHKIMYENYIQLQDKCMANKVFCSFIQNISHKLAKRRTFAPGQRRRRDIHINKIIYDEY